MKQFTEADCIQKISETDLMIQGIITDAEGYDEFKHNLIIADVPSRVLFAVFFMSEPDRKFTINLMPVAHQLDRALQEARNNKIARTVHKDVDMSDIPDFVGAVIADFFGVESKFYVFPQEMMGPIYAAACEITPNAVKITEIPPSIH